MSAMEKTGKQSSLAQYGSFDLEEMQDTAQHLPTGGGNYFKPRQGKNVVRFLPPLQGRKATKIWHKHFFSVGNERRSIICTKYQYSQPCAVCDRAGQMRASSSKLDQRKARNLEPQSHVYVNVVDMVDPEKGVQLWKMSPSLFKDIMSAIEMANVGKVFADPARGFNIIFKREGEGLKTEYKAHQVAREASPLPNAEELLAQQVDLETAENAPTDEEQDNAADAEYEDRGGGRGGGGKSYGGGRSRDQRQAKSIDYDEEDAEVVDDIKV